MPCQMRVGLNLWCLPLADVTWPKCTSLGLWCLLLLLLMLQRRCTHSTGYACISLDDDDACRCPMFLSRCAQTMSYPWRLLLMQLVVGEHYLANTRKPQTCRGVDAHTQRLICVGLSCCNLPLVDIPWYKRWGHNWYDFIDARRP